MSGGNIDEEKTARIILDEFRSGTIGKITLEKCVNGDGLNWHKEEKWKNL